MGWDAMGWMMQWNGMLGVVRVRMTVRIRVWDGIEMDGMRVRIRIGWDEMQLELGFRFRFGMG